MHPYALIILMYMWNCECVAGKAQSGNKCFLWLVQTGRSLHWCSAQTYTIVMFSLTTPTKNKRQREPSCYVECIASETSKGGKVVTISSLKHFLCSIAFCGVDSYHFTRYFDSCSSNQVGMTSECIFFTQPCIPGVKQGIGNLCIAITLNLW